MLAWCIIALLDFRTVLLSHAGKKEIAIEATTLSLSLVIFGMEVFTPQTANFMKKSELLRERAKEQAERRKGRRSRSDLGSAEHDDERRSLLGNQDGEDGSDAYDGGDTSDEEEADFLATLDILPHSSIQDEEERERKSEKVIPPPEVGQSLFALATFTYIGNFLFKHARQPATFQDIPDLRADDKSASVVLEFRAASKTYPRWLRPMGASGMRKRPPIFWQLCYYFRHYMAAQIGWAFVKPWLAVMPPLFIRLILQWATDRSAGREAKPSVALLFVAGLFLTQMATSLVSSQSLIIGRRLCIRSKAILTAEVFTKTLRRKDLAGAALQRPGEADKKEGQAKEDEEKGPATAGRIQNLVSVDTSKVSEVFAYVHFFVPEAPLSKLHFFSPKIPADIVCLSSAIIVALGMLFNTIGYSAFAAVATMLILLPIQSGVARFFMRYQSQVLAAADKRLSLTTEVFQAIKVLKFFAWEGKFQQKLDEKREAELAALRKRVIVFALGGISMCKGLYLILPLNADFELPVVGAPIMISLVTFILHTKGFKQPLEATTAFTALALFNVIRSPRKRRPPVRQTILTKVSAYSGSDREPHVRIPRRFHLVRPYRFAHGRGGDRQICCRCYSADGWRSQDRFRECKLDVGQCR
jgi:ABC-type multidrug transport system fused ATPase/permease subunit